MQKKHAATKVTIEQQSGGRREKANKRKVVRRMKTIKKLIEEFTGGIRTLQSLLSSLINPLTTDDECTRHASLAACYQLAQSVLKIGFALGKKVGYGEVGRFQHGVLCTWQLPWLAIEKP